MSKSKQEISPRQAICYARGAAVKSYQNGGVSGAVEVICKNKAQRSAMREVSLRDGISQQIGAEAFVKVLCHYGFEARVVKLNKTLCTQ